MNKTVYFLCRSFSYIVLKLFYRFKVRGKENIPMTGGVLILANHASYFDPPLVASSCPRPMNFMARSTLFEVPFFGRLIVASGAFPVRRGQADREALKRTLNLLEKGEVVLTFPEGTRSEDGNLRKGLGGAGMLAFSAAEKGAKVIPAKIIGTFKAYPKGASFPRLAKIEVIFGKPIKFSFSRENLKSKEIYRTAVDIVMEEIGGL